MINPKGCRRNRLFQLLRVYKNLLQQTEENHATFGALVRIWSRYLWVQSQIGIRGTACYPDARLKCRKRDRHNRGGCATPHRLTGYKILASYLLSSAQRALPGTKTAAERASSPASLLSQATRQVGSSRSVDGRRGSNKCWLKKRDRRMKASELFTSRIQRRGDAVCC